MNIISCGVAKNLKFDVPWLTDVLLYKYAVIVKGGCSLPRCRFHGTRQVRRALNEAHPFAAPASNSFDENRVLRGIRGSACPTRNNRHAGIVHDALGFQLVSHPADGIG